MGDHWGNAENWDYNVEKVKSFGFMLSSDPDIGAVAQWDNGTWGHVAYVEKVNPDGSIYISEYNGPSSSCAYGTRTIKGDGDWPDHFIWTTGRRSRCVDYSKLVDGTMLTWMVPLDHNTELAPSGNVSVKTWNWYNGLMVGLDNTNGSSDRTAATAGVSIAAFEFQKPVEKVIVFLCDFDGNTTLSAYKNGQVLKTLNISSSTPNTTPSAASVKLAK